MRTRLLVLVCCLAACGGASTKGAAPPDDPLTTSPAPALFEQGRALVARGDYIRAEQYLVAAMERGHPSDEVMPVLLDACVRGRRYQSALDHAFGQLRRTPEDWRLRYVVATLHEALGDRAKARLELERIIVGDPSFAKAHYSLGLMLDSAGDHERGAVEMQRYLELEPEGIYAADARARITSMPQSEPQPEPQSNVPVDEPAIGPSKGKKPQAIGPTGGGGR